MCNRFSESIRNMYEEIEYEQSRKEKETAKICFVDKLLMLPLTPTVTLFRFQYIFSFKVVCWLLLSHNHSRIYCIQAMPRNLIEFIYCVLALAFYPLKRK